MIRSLTKLLEMPPLQSIHINVRISSKHVTLDHKQEHIEYIQLVIYQLPVKL